jgi:uncharacterized protein
LGVFEIVLVFVAGALGGALNSVAGGGSFIVFPAMLLTGIPPVTANATTTAALWPAGFGSFVAYREHLPKDRRTTIVLSLASVIGGGFGARLLLVTSDETFSKILPWLLLAASLVFSFGPRLAGTKRRVPLVVGAIVQLVISSYGGYFGGGMGILMLATFTLMGMTHMHEMNALKVVLGLLINGMAIVLFLVAGKVVLAVAVPVAIGSIAGGFVGAAVAKRIAPARVRTFVLVFAWALTAFFFYRVLRK